MNYLVVLFKNKKRKKIIKSFVTKNKAESYFKKKIDESDIVKFNVDVENAKKVKYELGLLSIIDDSQLVLFKQDDIGRNVKIEIVDSDYKIIKIENYNISEKIFDWSTKKRISFDEFFTKYFKEKDLKSIFTLNNKLIIQKDEKINIFSLKNSDESKRFLQTLQEYMISQKRFDGLFVKDTDTIHRKYLYDLLEKNGVNKKRLYRQSTTFSERK
jgi:hypothetical protein